ncbi:MAG: ParB/RepB/Spo0J family partition protein [Polyangiales bacterium]
MSGAKVDKPRKAPDAKEPRRALGRGLDALLPVTQVAQSAASRESPFRVVRVEDVVPRADQPRKHFDELSLQELADSLREQGLIQPLIVRAIPGEPPRWELIAGERRWRAAQRAGMRDVPVVVKDVASDEAFEMALVENLQRQDLDPIETALAYRRLLDEHRYTHEQIASRIGKDRSTVSNTLRLLQLPKDVAEYVISRQLSEGHARAVLSAQDPAAVSRLAKLAVDRGWSVRQAELAARRGDKPAKPAADGPRKGAAPSANVRDLERQLEAALGMKAVIRTEPGDTSGTVEIAFDDLDQLDRFLARVLGS